MCHCPQAVQPKSDLKKRTTTIELVKMSAIRRKDQHTKRLNGMNLQQSIRLHGHGAAKDHLAVVVQPVPGDRRSWLSSCLALQVNGFTHLHPHWPCWCHRGSRVF